LQYTEAGKLDTLLVLWYRWQETQLSHSRPLDAYVSCHTWKGLQ